MTISVTLLTKNGNFETNYQSNDHFDSMSSNWWPPVNYPLIKLKTNEEIFEEIETLETHMYKVVDDLEKNHVLEDQKFY